MGATRIGRWSLAGVCACAVAVAIGPGPSDAFVPTGDALAVSQRDVRVFNNFTDAQANANATPDPSFPGFAGAPLAIWKGVVEWSSEPHGDGNGDPTQPGGLGSGGANFDATWQGLASDPGGLDDNVLSEISGSGGGVIAFCETPTSDGWRIRFYQSEIWWDDPNKSSFGPLDKDLQGVACHEYGHALGLNHTPATGATMTAFVPSPSSSWRSIEADDIAGVQSIYGVRSATKPSIDDYDLPAVGQLRLIGAHFAAAGNEVWFTRAGAGGDGTPVIASGLTSQNGGAEIVLSIPAAAGPGDVLVKVPGTAHDTLSNPFPFNPSGPPCLAPKVYGVAKVSSQGLPAEIGWIGQPSASFANFELTVFGVAANEQVVLFHGAAKQATPFLGGELSVARPFVRDANTVADFVGFASAQVPVTPSMIGTTRFYQFWFADAADPAGAGTSNALEVSFCP